MGLLSILGETYSYQESKEFFQEIKQKGLIQFLKLCEKFSNERLHNPPVLWGDEIEFHILNMNYITKEVKLQCDIDYIYKKFEEINAKTLQEFQIQPEYGSWMLETVPMFPFTYCCDLNPVIKNMATRRKVIQALLENDDIVCSFPVFPLLGTPDSHLKKKEIINGEESKADDILMENIYKHDDKKKNGLTENHHFEHKNLITHSQFINDEIINQHPRFPTLTKNVRERRGEKVNIKIPLFIDDNTHLKVTEEEPYPGFIYMDAMAFGMGNCCLQVTFSTKDMDNARLFYDQLAVLTPLIVINKKFKQLAVFLIKLPLTAGSPIFKGKLADIDSRWQSIVQSVDDRTFNERNVLIL